MPNSHLVFTSPALRFILANFLWVSSIGTLMMVTGKTVNTEIGLAIVAFLYMPSQ